ncbi:MAG: aldo/keto reductase [Clostridia bacterium]|nr:aldo/keto reductase [Clostridia bacterium]
MKYLVHRGIKIPLIGFGSYGFGLDSQTARSEENTVRSGVESFGMTLIDTAESYGDGAGERFLGKIIKDFNRNDLFIVDKILPENAEKNGFFTSCRNSLDRLGVDSIDLYLLHWREGLALQGVVDGMEELVQSGMIKHWGVSNFDTADMAELFDCVNGENCFCNQILYNICTRGPEYELIPWCKEHDVLVMAYSPLCHGEKDRLAVARHPRVADIARRENKTPESLMLSFVIRNNDLVTVFKTSDINRLKNNMQNVFAPITKENDKALSQLFQAPDRRTKLKTI